eukprot:2779-Eustigmatos_ZCMA.PRE.1
MMRHSRHHMTSSASLLMSKVKLTDDTYSLELCRLWKHHPPRSPPEPQRVATPARIHHVTRCRSTPCR